MKRKFPINKYPNFGWRNKKIIGSSKFPKETRKKMSNSHKGLRASEETKKKISKSHVGNKWGFVKGNIISKKNKEITSKRMKGNKIGKKFESGEKHWNWKKGITPINTKIRMSTEYKLWRKAVFERDNYTCIWCGNKQGKNLEADHIKPFSLFPELRFAIDNGRTLCIECHRKTDTYGNKRNWNK